MLEFAESVPFYGNMGRPQVDCGHEGLSFKGQGSNGNKNITQNNGGNDRCLLKAWKVYI